MLKLDLNLKQKLNISQKMIQSLKILEMNILELDDFLNVEKEENVMLDFESEIEKSSFDENFSLITNKKDISFEKFLKKEKNLQDYLLEQLGELKLGFNIYKTVEYLILNLEENGYLEIDFKTISKELNLGTEDIESAHKILTSFLPKGIGARTLKECLLIQSKNEKNLYELIENHLEDVANNKLNFISQNMNLSISEVEELILKLKKLNPKPGISYSTDEKINYIAPDILVKKEKNNDLKIEINLVNKIGLSSLYMDILKNTDDEATRIFLENKKQRTLMLIKAVDMRNETLKKITEFIINYQKEYFLYKFPLKPLRQSDVAKELGISISTVSRAITSKYIQYERGCISLKGLFNTYIKSNSVSRDYIKMAIKEIIKNENASKPFSDNDISKILSEREIKVNRRTVQKYREELRIKSSRNRRKDEKKK